MIKKSFNQSLIANGTKNGTLLMNDSSGFEVGATVFLSSKNQKIQKLKIAAKPSASSVVVVMEDDSIFDASQFMVTKEAKLSQPKDELLAHFDI